MASTRALSPSEDEMDSPQVTSKSRLQAMLDSISDNSDNESSNGSEIHRGSPTKNKFQQTTRSESPLAIEPIQQSEDEEDEAEEEVVKPRGRLAGRMLALDNNVQESQPQEALNVRERVMQRLLTKNKKSPTPSMDTQDLSGNNDEQEDEDLPNPRRALHRRPARSSTPESNKEAPQSSPGGMFVSPGSNRSKSPIQGASDSDVDLPANLSKNARLLAVVKRKREERNAQQAEALRKKKEELAERAKFQKSLSEDEEQEGSDTEAGQRLTQQARPTRKASKRALEEMNRETQRMSRNMQLAHEARTKKKITKASLFAKFNYKPINMPEGEPAPSSSPRRPDAETHDTPPTSPAALPDKSKNTETSEILQDDDDNDLPTLAESLSEHTARFSIHSSPKIDGGKKAAHINSSPPSGLITRTSKQTKSQLPTAEDSDSDLEIVPVGKTKSPSGKGRLDYVFDRVPAQKSRESHSLHALRMLAHLNSPPQKTGRGKNAKPSITIPELGISLQQQARRQANREREERLQALRDRGVYVPTAEEREKELAEVEDLMARARREGEEIMRREREAAKKKQKENGIVDPLGDSSDDEDWDGEQFSEDGSNNGSDDGNDEGDEDDMESDEEDNGNDEDIMIMAEDVDDLKPAQSTTLIDDQASENETSEDDVHMEDDDEAMELPQTRMKRSRQSNVISDDEDEPVNKDSPNGKSPVTTKTDSPVAPQSVLRSATKTFIPGLPVAGPAGLGLTQIFAGTMDDSQVFDNESEVLQFTPHKEPGNDSMAFLRRLPPPTMGTLNPMEEGSQEVIKDSQVSASQAAPSQADEAETQGIQLDFTQAEVHGFDSLMQDPLSTQVSDIAMTQDVGFQKMSPIKGRFSEAPVSTIDTVLVDSNSTTREIIEESPIVKRKGRLQRRMQTTTFSDDEEDVVIEDDDNDFEISANAFDVMRKAVRKKAPIEEFNKKNSEAKNMVHEQAEESEDEYAGLGGASDDESGGEEDALVKEMIDDEGGKDVDERQIAAFFAEKDRQSDEKQVEKLFKDITNGMLRRKRGADYDLSDSDDDGEARRRMKRKEFAKMRKALLEDERIGKIAENPKREAFLRAIEDRDVGDEMDFLDHYDDSEVLNAGISQSQDDSQQAVADSQPDTSMGPPKRKRSEMSDIENRPPPHMRRTKGGKRPSNISEVRESLSSLIDEPNSVQDQVELSDDSDLEIEDEDDIYNDERVKSDTSRDPFALRRPQAAVIDRISLKRAASSNLSANTKLAFSTASNSNFKVPALLRRTTTSTSTSSSISAMSATERMAGAFGEEKIKRGGSKTSGINYFARENERREKVREGEKRREEKRFKGAEGRRKAVGGLFGKGKFE